MTTQFRAYATEENLVFYPLTLRTSVDDSSIYKSSIQGIVSTHTDDEWKKLITELKKCFQEYENIYGIKGINIERYKRLFVKCQVKVIDQKKFEEYEEKYNFGGVVASFINHDLNAGGYPSFYKDDYLEKKFLYSIKQFVLVETKQVK